MRKMLVVVVIAGVACLEPAPQTPANTATVEHIMPPPAPQTPVSTGVVAHRTPPTRRIKIVESQRAYQLPDMEQTDGPVIASGTVAGRPWSRRGRIDTRGAATWLQTGNGGGGGGSGPALPFQDLSWKKMRTSAASARASTPG